jgi:hypothetical protein
MKWNSIKYEVINGTADRDYAIHDLLIGECVSGVLIEPILATPWCMAVVQNR